MKTLTLKADDAIIDRIVSLFDLFPKEQYDLFVLPYTEEERKLDELRKTLDFDDEEQVMEFCVNLSDIGKQQWWSKHKKQYLQEVIHESRH